MYDIIAIMKIKENVDIKSYTTLKIGGKFRYFTIVESEDDLFEIYKFSEQNKIKLFILGGGSNMIFSEGVLNVLAVKIEIKGFELLKETNDYVDIKIGAGENWDKIVERTVGMDLSGLEALSSIPGTVGATPVQNVGAYGAEVSDTILEIRVFAIKNKEILILSNKDCEFKYRNSIFKNEAKGKYIIMSVVYRLHKDLIKIPEYPGVEKYFIENNIDEPGLKDIRNAIIAIRNTKLPNPEEIPNVGSFFKNPIVKKDIAIELKNKYLDLPTFPIDEKTVKIPAGWLIDKAGLKGKSFGKISVYKNNALVLINNGEATKDDLMKVKNEIINIIQDKFGITLEQEPEMM